ncbi:MAG: nucleotide exchange factor GrpE [Chloroflexi bacterium]|jgi:molecular chaperone GrpE|nr:nucleotide exchange factor GrpE [Chloroflexota bacterium]
MTTRKTRAEERIEALDVSPTSLLEEIERLKAALAEANATADERLAQAQRAQADYANLRRRTEADREAALGLASEILLGKVLDLADDFDRAVEHVPADARDSSWFEGVVAIDRKLRQLLDGEGVSPVEALGRPFDPREHEAIKYEAGTGRPEGEVVAETRRGYRLRDRVLRPALVVVSDGSPAAADSN